MPTEKDELLSRVYNDVGKYIVRATVLKRRIELALMVITTITSGTLFSLLAGVAKTKMMWTAAILSTTSTFLTAYKRSLGPDEALVQAKKLHKQAGDLLAKLRSTKGFSEDVFWREFKEIEQGELTLRWLRKRRDGPPPRLQ